MIKYPKQFLLNKQAIFIVFLSMLVLTSCGQNTGNTKEPVFKVQKTEEEWKAALSQASYNILRQKETEPAFSGKYVDWNKKGIFKCKACDNPLFSSETKFKSGTGWPSFYDYLNEKSILERPDKSMGWSRVEIICQSCGSHIGHVFEDGPKPTGLRYCMNSLALSFEAKQ